MERRDKGDMKTERNNEERRTEEERNVERTE